ncbi:MAG: NAD(P)H-dependent oxidoreductase [Bacillota bacterium]|nr:NAD(P)H-dependent oxidoreductase [Bacillota bacterium]MDW7676973.1 NAD(P)H-dependent oxidoreductase [Bacillota bacterium]
MVILMMPPSTPDYETYVLRLLDQPVIHRISTIPELETFWHKEIPAAEPYYLVIAAQLDSLGLNLALLHMIQKLTSVNPKALQTATGFVIVQSANEWHTKTFASWLILVLNALGCRFMGHPVLEMTVGLNNLNQWEKTTGTPRGELILQLGQKSMSRFLSFTPERFQRQPRLSVLHASSRNTSNTLSLWNLVKRHLQDIDIEEYHVANGTVMDCIGCPYHTCLYFGRQQSCFYGGDIIQELFPAIERSDGLMWICPNYNDSLSANLMAVINRLTALYRTQSFYEKKIFAVIVSGNSGSDAVARQLIDALCINKGFQLPPYFCLTATAYDPGSIYQVPAIEKRAADFAALIMAEWAITR